MDLNTAVSIAGIWDSAWPIIVAVIFFLVMIVIHEFGHFALAKLMGVRVNEFSVGFGPAIFKKQGKETLYSVRLVPFGGFCSMEGEDSESEDSRAFCNKKPLRRFLIVAAGAVFNILFGFIIMAIILAPQKQFISTAVAGFQEEAVSCGEGGIQVGDRILSVNGRGVSTSYDLSYTFTGIKESTVKMTVLRDGKRVSLPNVPFATETDEASGINYVNVDFYVEPIQKNVLTYIVQTVKSTVSYVKVIWWSLLDMVTGKYGVSAIGGPVAVTDTIGKAAKAGLTPLLQVICLITINLGVFNLLPLPALDGGRLLFILIELIFRKPVPRKYEAWVHAAGFAILLLLIALVTVKDIVTLVGG